MLNPVTATDLISHQQQEFKAQDSQPSDSADKGAAAEKAPSGDNPANFDSISRMSQKLEGSDQSQRNTVSPTSMINTANETMTNQAYQIKKAEDLETKSDGIGIPDKGNVAQEFKITNEQTLFEKVRDSNPLTQVEAKANEEPTNELFDSSLAQVANDEKFKIAEFQPEVKNMDQPIKALDEQMAQIKSIKAQASEVPDRVKGSDDGKWDSVKMQELASSVGDEMSANGESSMSAQANISPEQTLAMLR